MLRDFEKTKVPGLPYGSTYFHLVALCRTADMRMLIARDLSNRVLHRAFWVLRNGAFPNPAYVYPTPKAKTSLRGIPTPQRRASQILDTPQTPFFFCDLAKCRRADRSGGDRRLLPGAYQGLGFSALAG